MTDEPTALLIFRTGGNRYALDLRDVAEITAPPAVYPVPQPPPSLIGVTNVHGTLTAVCTLPGLAREAPYPAGTLLVLDRRRSALALLVDVVERIAGVDQIISDRRDGKEGGRILALADGELHLLSLDRLLDEYRVFLAAPRAEG